MKYVYINLLLLLLSIGCNNRENGILHIEKKNHNKVVNKNSFIATSGPIIPVGHYIIGMDYTLDTCFYYLGLENDVFERFAHRGQGPDEYLYPNLIQYINDTILGIYDAMKREYIWIFNPISLGNYSRKNRTISFDQFSFRILSTCFDQYIGIGPYENGMFELYDSIGNRINHFYEFPYKDSDEKNINNRLRSMAYQGGTVLNPQKDKMAYACKHADIIHFYEVKENSIEIIKKIENSYPDYIPQTSGGGISAAIKKENRVCYLSLYGTSEFVYVLYSGIPVSKFLQNNKYFSGDMLYIYNWNGDIKRKILLDIECIYMCVSHDNKRMYAIAECPEPEIVFFEL
jgi:hypothetical protein